MESKKRKCVDRKEGNPRTQFLLDTAGFVFSLVQNCQGSQSLATLLTSPKYFPQIGVVLHLA